MFPEKSRTSNEKMLFSINKALAKLQKGKWGWLRLECPQ
jgi:hypothetical protein